MIYTVTLNPAVDKTVMIPNFTSGAVNRIQKIRIDAGGKGINVSKCLQRLGLDSTVCAILGGNSGNRILSTVKEMGLTVLAVTVDGETRTNLKIVDTERHENTDINEPGPAVGEDTLLELGERIAQGITAGDILILSGSLPKGVQPSLYGDWIRYFAALGVTVILDADGEPMRLGVQAKPGLIKPNDLELSRLVGKPLETEEIVVLYDEVIRLKGLVNELQDLSKLEAGHAVLDKTLIKFADYFEDFAVLLDAEAESRNMTLEVNLKEAPEYCYADPKRLKQIVLNLVNNAFRYTPEGGTVTIIAKAQNGDFLFSVQDTGMGIAPEDVNKIFDRFYRTDRSRDRESGGSGLGLAITKALVDAHGGWIKVDSQLNAGTTFTIMLPGWKDIV